MRTYYNEWDKPTAAWLSALGDGCHLPSGRIDTRSIRDVRASDLFGYDQCHFFAGIGGWPLALRLAGYGELRCWTGSPPCQPFSVAGQQRGKDDHRHLAPVWLNLVRECRPPVLFGEQVADAIRHGWLDDLFNALEEYGYACGAAVLPACSVGAPHIRKRLFFGAVRMDNAAGSRRVGKIAESESKARDEARLRVPSGRCAEDRLAHTSGEPCKRLPGRFFTAEEREHRAGEQHGPLATRHSDGGAVDEVAYANGDGCSAGREIRPVCPECDVEHGGAEGRLADANKPRSQGWPGMPECADEQPTGSGSLESRAADPHNHFWSGADWLGCRDGKFRPVEPGTQPLAHGLPARVGRLRGYGNAIVPQVAATFIKEFIGAAAEIANANVGGER